MHSMTRPAILTALIFAFSTQAISLVHAQARSPLTAEGLLASSIEQIGAQHRDVASAVEQFKKGALLDCRNLLKQAREKDPKLPPDGVLMARMLYAGNQPGLAREELERTVREEPNDPEPYLIFGEIAFQQRHFTDAELAFGKGYDMTKKFTANPFRRTKLAKRSLSGLAGVAESREDWASAATHLKTIVQNDRSDVSNTTRLARALFEQDTNVGDGKGNEAQAYDLLIKLYEKNQDSVRRPEITMGSMYQAAGEKKITANLMKKASSKDETGLQTQLTVARWALGTGDLALAQQCADRGIKIDPNSMEARLVAGLTARYKGNLPAARKILETAHLQSPSNLAAILQLAVVLAEGGEVERRMALEYSQLASQIYPDVGRSSGREAAVTTSWILYKQGRVPDALRVLQKALAGGGVSSESSYYAAKIVHQTNPDLAKRLLGTALKGDGVFPARSDAEALLQTLGG